MNLVSALDYCTNQLGKTGGIPETIGDLVHIAILIIQIVVPVLLIIWGSLDFAKGVMASDEDKIKAGQKKFIQRLIAAIVVFLIVAVVKLVINTVGNLSNADEGNFGGDAWGCASELIKGKSGKK